jgi:hypothetical protein
MSSHESTWPSAEELEYFTLAELSVDYHLLSMLCGSKPAHLPPVQESVCLAFLMYGPCVEYEFRTCVVVVLDVDYEQVARERS